MAKARDSGSSKIHMHDSPKSHDEEDIKEVPLKSQRSLYTRMSGQSSCDSRSLTQSLTDDGSLRYARRESDDRSSTRSRRNNASDEYEFRSKRIMQELTINKLRFDDVGLVGRQAELQQLQACLDSISDDSMASSRKDLVWISGYSGVGKTALASSVKVDKGVIATGKFDYTNMDVPYGAIATAFSSICEDVTKCMDSQSQELRSFRETLLSKLGSRVHLLSSLIPPIAKIVLDDQEDNASVLSAGSHDFNAAQKRWEYSFRVLTRELSALYSPLVLVVDNMQWADKASLKLIDLLITDIENENPLMIVGCYRSNEVHDSHILAETISNLDDKKDKYKFNTTTIELGNLELTGVHEIVMTLLSIDDASKTEELAEICYKRTLGNAFFVIEFLSMLQIEEFLTFNLGLMQWTWDCAIIDKETMSSRNVVELVHSRMTRLSVEAQRVLQYAACLGTTINVEVLCILWTHQVCRDEKELRHLIKELEEGNFLERFGVENYRWVHDKIKESALLLGDASTPMFQFEVGNTLFNHLSSIKLEEMLFVVTDLINTLPNGRRVEFAELNLRAAEKSRSYSAFHSAATHVTKGYAFLPSSKWEHHKLLVLRLCTLGAQMELSIGRVEQMEAYCNEILSQPPCTYMERYPIYLVKAHKMSEIDMHYGETIEFLLKVLSEDFGVQLFRSRAMLQMKAVATIFQASHRAKKMGKDACSKLNPMVDPKNKAVMSLLSILQVASYMNQDIPVHMLGIAKMVNMTMKHGVHQLSGFSFVTLGAMSMFITQNFQIGARFAEISRMIQDKTADKYGIASIAIAATTYVLPWTKPIPALRSILSNGYGAGMRTGNLEMAQWCQCSNDIFLPFLMGKRLDYIEARCPMIVTQCEELKLGYHVVLSRLHWHVVSSLMGRSNEFILFKAESIEAEGWKIKDIQADFFKLYLHVHFGENKEGAELAMKMGDDFAQANPTSIHIMPETFMRSLLLYSMARATNKRKFMKVANRLRKRIESWIKKGNPNVVQMYSLLCAEQASYDRKLEKAQECYRQAIVLAARTGQINYAALANKKYADFLDHHQLDEDERQHRVREAIRFYEEWGAVACLDHLRKKL